MSSRSCNLMIIKSYINIATHLDDLACSSYIRIPRNVILLKALETIFFLRAQTCQDYWALARWEWSGYLFRPHSLALKDCLSIWGSTISPESYKGCAICINELSNTSKIRFWLLTFNVCTFEWHNKPGARQISSYRLRASVYGNCRSSRCFGSTFQRMLF